MPVEFRKGQARFDGDRQIVGRMVEHAIHAAHAQSDARPRRSRAIVETGSAADRIDRRAGLVRRGDQRRHGGLVGRARRSLFQRQILVR